MSKFDAVFGHNYNWTNGAARSLHQEDFGPVQRADKDCSDTKSIERAIVQSAVVKRLRSKLHTAELVARLPQGKSPSRSIDEICAETLTLIDLLDSEES